MPEADSIAIKMLEQVTSGASDLELRSNELAEALARLMEACRTAHDSVGAMRTPENWQAVHTISAALSDAHVVSSILSDLVAPSGNSEVQLVLERRRGGRPVNWEAKREESLHLYRAARLVEFLCRPDSEGLKPKQEAVIAHVAELSKRKGRKRLSRKAIFSALGTRRTALHMMPDLSESELRNWAVSQIGYGL